MKVTESIFKSFFEKKTLKPKTQWVPFVPRAPRPWESWQKQCLPGKWRRWWFRGWGEQWKGTGMEQLTCWVFQKKHDEFQLLHIALLQGQFNQWGNVWSTADTKKDSERKVTTNEGCVLSEAMSSDTLALEMSEFAEDSLKVIGFSFSNQTWSWGNLPCPKGCFHEKFAYMRFHDQVHLCCAGLDFGISGWFERDQSIQIVSNDKNQRVMKASFFFIQWRVALIFTRLAQLATLVHMSLIGNRQLAIRNFKRQKIPTLLY